MPELRNAANFRYSGTASTLGESVMPACVHGISPLGACGICTPPGSIHPEQGDRRMVICGDTTYEERTGAWYICTLDPHTLAQAPHYHELVERWRNRRAPGTDPPVMVGTLPPDTPVRRATIDDPLCLHRNPTGDGTVCALPPDHALSGHGHYYVRLGGPGPGAGRVEPSNPPGGEPPTSQPLGEPATRPADEYESRRDPEPGQTMGRGSMASVAEVNAAIDQAIEAVQRAHSAIHAANDEMGEARLMLLAASEGSLSSLPGAAVAAVNIVVENLNDAAANGGNAINACEEWKASL